MRTIVVTAVFGTLTFCGVSRADDKTADKDVKALEGTWQMVEGAVGGKPLPPAVAPKITLTLSGGKYVVMAENKDEGTVKYFPDVSPKAMEVTGTNGPNKGKTFPAIYERKGDTLTICYDLSGKARPTEFKSKPGTLLFLATYKKAKP
ncbi:MAG TPA: TIGR03067 domain-containing protein [Gemmataceae bacterium]|jgi:uncharacterized protein (TIGR03067 family)|nr:TIGR03067 domain-containing protein [Gemmataceae bacterium]